MEPIGSDTPSPNPDVEGMGPLEIIECTLVGSTSIMAGSTTASGWRGMARFATWTPSWRRFGWKRCPDSPRPSSSTRPDLCTPMPGRVVRVEARVGDSVRAGQVVVVLEAMKMEHTLRAPHDGTVGEVDCSPGDQVEAGRCRS